MFGRPMRRMGRPGLLGTVARTAVVAGTASAVAGGVSRRQQARAVEQQEAEQYREQQFAAEQPTAQPAYTASTPRTAPAPDNGSDDLINQLRELGELRSSGVLTEDEFAAQKARLLNS